MDFPSFRALLNARSATVVDQSVTRCLRDGTWRSRGGLWRGCGSRAPSATISPLRRSGKGSGRMSGVRLSCSVRRRRAIVPGCGSTVVLVRDRVDLFMLNKSSNISFESCFLCLKHRVICLKLFLVPFHGGILTFQDRHTIFQFCELRLLVALFSLGVREA